MFQIKYFGMMAMCMVCMLVGHLPAEGLGSGDTVEGMDRQEIEDYFLEYWGYMHSRNYGMLENELIYYFPNLNPEKWFWDIVEDGERGFLFEVYENMLGGTRYKVQYCIRPDFSLELLEDTVQVNELEGYFSLYLGDEDYVYHGCMIQEYTGVFRLEEGGQGLKAEMPLLSTKENPEWNEVNRNMWDGLEDWYREMEGIHGGDLILKGEIKTLNPKWFSVLFQGTYRENGKEEPVALGITVSIGEEKRICRSYFQEEAEEDAYYDYYMEDGMIYAIDTQGGGCRYREAEQVDCAYVLVTRVDHSVYYPNGVGAVQSYYDLFFVMPEAGRLEETVNEHLESEMGRFVFGIKRKFAEYILAELDMDEMSYYARMTGDAWCYCYMKGEVVYNNHQKIRIRYKYSVSGGKIQEKGEAEVVYDLASGTVEEYEDWQSGIEEKIQDILY